MVDDIEAIAEADHAPVVIHDAGRLARAARPRPCAIVLQATHHVVEGKSIVRMNLIELAQWNVVNSFPRFAAVVTDGNSTVLPVPHPFRVLWIEPQRVEVDVCAASDGTKGLASVNGSEQSRGY